MIAIVDNCPHLEYLDIRSCGNITMNDALKAKCALIKTKIYMSHIALKMIKMAVV